jgi:hypothetical protein
MTWKQERGYNVKKYHLKFCQKLGKIPPVDFRISLQQAQISAYLQLEDNPPVNLQFNKVNTEPDQPKVQQGVTEPTGQPTLSYSSTR